VAPSHRSSVTRRGRLVGSAVGLVVIVGGGIALAVGLSSSGSGHAGTSSTGTPASVTATTTAPTPITVNTISPRAGSSNVALTSAIDVTFSAPIAKDSPDPKLTPAVAGAWTHPNARELRFTPAARFLPDDTVKVTIPGGNDGITSVDGATLGTTFGASFTTAPVPTLRLEQLLAELNYLPVSFVPGTTTTGATGASTAAANTTPVPTSTTMLDAESTNPNDISLSPVAGSFAWRWANTPSQLAAGWFPGSWDVVAQGAVMAFEYDNGLPVDGEPGPSVWNALLTAVAARKVDPNPYDYVLVTETVPETLYLWSDGHLILQTPANTGVSGATTETGTWPVYLRFTSTTMTGTNPDGTHYSDPGVPWVSYFNGSDAVHGFPRSAYGYPQSDGCVELPIPTAEKVFPYDTYGTLVTVTTGVLTAEMGGSPPEIIGGVPAAPTTTTSTSTTTTTTTPPKPKPKPHPTTTTTTSTTTTTTTTTTTPPATTTTVSPPTTTAI
jgi:hypothetical protein